MTVPPDPQRLSDALHVAAQIVARHGAAFLPAFLLLEAEAAKLHRQTDAMARALALGGGEGRQGPGAYRAIRASAARRPSSAPPSP
jgi:hypothetical protein